MLNKISTLSTSDTTHSIFIQSLNAILKNKFNRQYIHNEKKIKHYHQETMKSKSPACVYPPTPKFSSQES